MPNFKEETLSVLENRNKSIEDIRWIGCGCFKIEPEEFWKLANRQYDNGYGRCEIPLDLLIVGDNWWMERREYDGAEWWEFREQLAEPEKTQHINTLFLKSDTNYDKELLCELMEDD